MGLFITFEGPEGSGKTTHARLLAAWLTEAGHTVVTTREPGGTPIGDVVRNLLLDPASTGMYPETEFLLFSAARAQHVRQVIRPQLEKADVVICDRFGDSSLAYQGYGRQLDLGILRTITAFATGKLVPDLVVCLDLPVIEGLQRKSSMASLRSRATERSRTARGLGTSQGDKRGASPRRKRGTPQEEWNRMEQEQLEFHERVRQGFQALAQAEPDRWLMLDARLPIPEIQAQIRVRVSDSLRGECRGN